MATDTLHCEREGGQHVLASLLDLRRAVAETLGRDQYVYRLLDRAIETGYPPAQQDALAEFELQPDDVKNRVRAALFATLG